MAGVKIDVARFAVDGEHIFKEFEKQAAALQEIETVISSIEDAWESEAQRLYADRFRASKKRIEEFNDTLREDFVNMEKYVRDWVVYDEWLWKKLHYGSAGTS